jgi:nucleotide sugar dehydrogenase
MNIGVIGDNDISLAFALLCERSGHSVLLSHNKKDEINKKITNSSEPLLLSYIVTTSKLSGSTDNLEVISNSEIIFSFIDHNILPNGRIDISNTMSLVEEFGFAFENEIPVYNKTLVICSTVNPGDIKDIFEILNPYTVDVCYHPINVRVSSIIHDFEHTDNLILGTSNPITANKITNIYSGFSKKEITASIMSFKSAEIVKLSLSVYLAMKINFVNFIGDLVTVSNITDELQLITQAMSKDSRIGSEYFKYGFGYGGPNLPKEIKSFNKYCNDINMKIPLISELELINDSHLKFIKETLLESNQDKLIPFNIYKISYKDNTDVTVESQKLLLIYELLNEGYNVNIVDSTLLTTNKKIMLELTNDFSGRIKIYKDGTKPQGFDIKL